MKKVYCIRHGKALHNVLQPLIGKIAYTDEKYTDTPLVDEGQYQSEKLGLTWREKSNIEVVFVSPLTRTLDTAINIFKNMNVKLIANEEIIEYPQGKEYCNLRKCKSELEKKYPMVDFSNLDENPKYWKGEIEETFKELNERDLHFKSMLKNCNYKKICIVSHSTYLKQFLFGFVDSVDEKHELKHCFPYEKPLQQLIVTESI